MLGALILLLMGVHNYLRWQGSQYFGEVLRMTEGGFVVSDIKVGERTIDVGQETVVRRGRQEQDDGLQVGDRVMIVGESTPSGHIRAGLIRIIEDGPARFEK
ncbi:MAG: DUF5666 domain-containing protein [Patescibacteria group bacterium]